MQDNNNYPLVKYVSVLVFAGMAAVLVTLSYMERPIKQEQFNLAY